MQHHHRQKAPSRGNLDAINVHPFEFAVGEYLHLLPIYLVPCHAYAVVFFVLAGGVLASLNHTRLDISLPLGIYSVKVPILSILEPYLFRFCPGDIPNDIYSNPSGTTFTTGCHRATTRSTQCYGTAHSAATATTAPSRAASRRSRSRRQSTDRFYRSINCPSLT